MAPAAAAGVAAWGSAPGTKRLANLWAELAEGEIVLEDSQPPKRVVHVASVIIRDSAGAVLVESHQEMEDGTVRVRNRPLSEKMRPGEGVEAACLRGIVEELGSDIGPPTAVTLLRDSYVCEEEERESLSYPGLATRYIIHTMAARIAGLPAGDFVTEEDEHPGGEWQADEPLRTLHGCMSNDEEDEEDDTHDEEANEATLGYEPENGAHRDNNGAVIAGSGAGWNSTAMGVRRHFWVWRQEEG
eukprot:SM000005S17335  [mRNA]  locus=s5:1578638:1579835:- [translate_table: standard]